MKRPRTNRESSARGFVLALGLPLAACSSPPPPAPAVPPEEKRLADLHALDAAHRYRAALELTDEWLASAPDDPAALDWKVKLLRDLGDERRALDVVQARRAKAPQDAMLAYEEGELLAHVGHQDDRALAAFDAARALAPEDWRPAVGAAALLLAKKEPDSAGALARLAPFLDGPHVSSEALFHQGLALEVAHDVAGACAAFEKALVVEPLHVPAMRDLALLVEKSGDEKGALDLWRRVKRTANPLDDAFTKEVDVKIKALAAKVAQAEKADAAAKAEKTEAKQ